MKGLPWFALSAGAVALLVGCSQVPQDEIDAVRAELDEARARGIAEYAPAEMQHAEDSWQALEAELKVQDEKMGLMRSYDATRQKADDVRKAIASARETSVKARTEAEGAARASLEEARSVLEEVRMLAANLPRAKGARTDPGAEFQPGIAAAESRVAEAESLLAAESFLQAHQAALAAKESVLALEASVREKSLAKM